MPSRNRNKKDRAAQKRYTSERRWETNKARRIEKHNAWLTLCGRVRAKFGKVKDMGRQVRKLKRGEA